MDKLLIFSTAANAVLPVVILILLGWLLHRTGIMPDSFVKTGNKMVFNIFLPAMLFINVYNMDGLQSISWDIVLYGCVVVFGIFLMGILFAMLLSKKSACRSVLLQASFRSNMSIIGLSLAAALGSSEAVATASMLSAFTVAEFNVLAVISFTVFSDDRQAGLERLKKTVFRIGKNPLILSIVAGMLVLCLRSLQQKLFGRCVFSLERDLKFIYTTLNNLKAITTPFALVVMGGQFVFSEIKQCGKEIIGGTLLRIVFAPLVGIGLAALLSKYTGFLHFGPNEYPAMIALFGAPAAVSGPTMASQMGGDKQLATQIVVWSSVGSILTVFAVSCILLSTGLLAVS